MTYRRLLLLTAAAASLGLAGCDQNSGPATGAPIAALPLAQAEPLLTVPLAPGAEQLPAAPRPLMRRAGYDRYRYVDDAYWMSDAFGDSPPDYTVDYDGYRPWVWRSDSGAYRMVEWIPGGERDYYYRAGADWPFLVRDDRYAYAYDDGVLVEIYDVYGRPVSDAYWDRDADLAGRYLYRARQLYAAAVNQPRQAAYATQWRDRRGDVTRQRDLWAAEQQRNEDWRSWRDQQGQQRQQVAWDRERAQRQAYVARTASIVAAAPRDDRRIDLREDQARFEPQRRDQAESQRRDQVAAQARDRERTREFANGQERQRLADTARRDELTAREHAQQQAEVGRRQADQAQRRQVEGQRRDQAEHQQRQQQQAERQHQQQQAEQGRAAAKAAHDQQQAQAQAQAQQANAKAQQAQSEAAAQHGKAAAAQAAAQQDAPGKGRGQGSDDRPGNGKHDKH